MIIKSSRWIQVIKVKTSKERSKKLRKILPFLAFVAHEINGVKMTKSWSNGKSMASHLRPTKAN